MVEKIKVVESEPPENPEILAEAIIEISSAIRRLLDSGINRRGVVILLQADTKLSRASINLVLDSLGELEDLYCTKEG